MKSKQLAVGIIIFILSLAVGLWGYADSYITSLSARDNLSRSSATDIPLVPGPTVRTTVIARNDFFGTVKFRIKGFNRINTNTIVFRMREKGQTNWLVTNTYKTDRFPDGDMYPFGFPVINQSKDKIYEIEVYSPDGSNVNGVAVVSGKGNIETEYRYPWAELRSNKKLLFWFAIEKMKELIFSWQHLLYWSMFVVPAVVYIFDLPFLFLFTVAVYGLVPVEMYNNLILFIGVCIGGISIAKKQPEWPFIVSIFSLGLAAVTMAAGLTAFANRFSSVVFIGLLSGVCSFMVLSKEEK